MPTETNGIDGPESIPMQPYPTGLKFGKLHTAEGTVTAISRTWGEGQGQLCGLCPKGACNLDRNNACLVMVGADIPEASCPLFSLRDFLRDGGAGARVRIAHDANRTG